MRRVAVAIGLVAGALAAAAPALSQTKAQKPAQTTAQGKPTAPQSVAARATALLRAGRPVDALRLLRPAVAARPNDLSLLFLVGRAGIAAAQRHTGRTDADDRARTAFLDAAIAALRRMLTIRPGLVRARLELARAFFLKGEDSLAREHFERVLAGKPPAAVAANVQRFLGQIRARKRWTVRVGMALAPDSNISGRTDERTILIDTQFGRLPFTYNTDSPPTSGIGLAIWAGGEYQHPLSDRWRLRAGGDVSRREYQSDPFDRMFVSTYLGPRWLISPTTEASLLASLRLSWLSDEPDFRDLGLRFEGRHRLTRRLSTTFDASWHDRRNPGRARLDGPVVDLAAGLGWTATPTIRLDAAAGWGLQRTKQENLRHSYRWLRAGATALLPWGFTVGGSGTVRWTGYEGNWAPFVLGGGERRDQTYSLRLNVHNRAVTIRGFSPQLSVVHEWRRSNAQLHDYRRTFGELRLVRLF
ncbi:MAG: surface lipoprotein assembly modifier [Rhodospirillaceae bacterium]|nr:surface lipoprotein assembly modifier [Rhodospirillaceae bacterium]MDE0254623.1 surface lipoprotein assembly modifier [Rhodospirillaceae bacterium]MDE0617849.1 surface lipoprotein assembly modifier [Rhodospirillaceae bacterium]